MAIKLTKEQSKILDRIQSGKRNILDPEEAELLRVQTFEYSNDKPNDAILASRTVVKDDRDGKDGRVDYRTEMYRIYKDGAVRRL